MSMFTIDGILTAEDIGILRERISQSDARFQDGRKTAGWQAREVKNNEQLDSIAAGQVTRKVRDALLSNPVFNAAARPSEITSMLVSRYGPGMEYGFHVDDALMGGKRTDLSFTVFLNDPADYDGGELVLAETSGEIEVKEKSGTVFLYPSTTLHRVAPVTRGERLVVVGWIRSLVRSVEARDILFQLDNAIAELRAINAPRETVNRLIKAKNNLLRLWVED